MEISMISLKRRLNLLRSTAHRKRRSFERLGVLDSSETFLSLTHSLTHSATQERKVKAKNWQLRLLEFFFVNFGVLVRSYLLAHPMVHISLGYILLDIQCLGHLFHHFMVVPFLNHMLFQLVEPCMDQLEPVPHVPQPGSRGFGAGRGNAGAPIGSHLPHQQGTQQNVGNLGSTFNFPALENPNSQPSVGGPLSQPGFVNNMPQGPSQTFRDGFSMAGMSQGSHVPYNVADFSTQASQSGYAVDYVTQGAQGGFPGNFMNQNSQAGYSRFGTGNDFMSQAILNCFSYRTTCLTDHKDDASQNHYGVANANQLQSQGFMNSLYSQPFAHYNTQPMNLQAPQQQQQQQPPQQGQSSQNQKIHYNG
ncbi:hypothetical protein Prudu_013710 [Prunus dulcis]|uniref:Uncharacterized protein n=1 Tax=Prunus dulcis TaxID=3755 RepID=A0A4Y1RGG2_PRUDU|nr:hypothetical protein Prudu_013710 [Prunus dulcis]